MPLTEKFKEVLTWSIAIASTGVTLLSAGFGFGLAVGASSSTERKEHLEDQLQQCQKGQEGIIAELALCQAKNRSVDKQPDEDAEGRKLTVAKGDTGEIKGHLIISVVGITTSRDPFSYVVSARFGAPGKETLPVPRLQVGDRISYSGYEIRLLAADLATARFGIREVGATSN